MDAKKAPMTDVKKASKRTTPNGLIFDCDGTVLDTMEFYYPTWVKTCKKHGIHITKKKFYQMAGVPVKGIYETLIKEQNLKITSAQIDAIMKEKKILVAEAKAKMKGPIPPIASVVKIIKENYGKIPMAVASSGHRVNVITGLKDNGLLSYFGGERNVVCQEDLPAGTPCKPAPDIFLEAARRINVPPNECRGYEDADVGIEALQRAGMEAVDVRAFPGHPYQRLVDSSCFFDGKPDKVLSLVFVLDESDKSAPRVLLGLKKRGFGKMKFNGYGGKQEMGETIAECAARELEEESGLVVCPTDMTPRGNLFFTMLQDGMVGKNGEVSSKLLVHVFTVDIKLAKKGGIARETGEMRPQWFSFDDVPLTKMWADDQYWLPKLLTGKKCLRGGFVFADEGNIKNMEVNFA